jgi:hypothetical protein
MTYKNIQDIYKGRNKKTISTCAIADAKRKLGYPVKISGNRKNINKIQKSATEEEIKELSKILRGK